MKRSFYTFSIIGLIGLMTGGYFATERYNTPKYQEKDYTGMMVQLGRADIAVMYRNMMLTGSVDGELDMKAVQKVQDALKNESSSKNPASDMYWFELGPNFIGGRTRALHRDNQPGNEQVLYAGAVAGGVWVTYNGGELWQGYNGDLPSNMIGDIGQTADGKLFVGTGPGHDGIGSGKISSSGFIGSGLFRRVLDNNGGVTYEKVFGPDNNWTSGNTKYGQIHRVMGNPVDANKLYIGTNGGLMVSANAGATASEVSFFNAIEITNGINYEGHIDDIQVSSDGKTVYAASRSGTIYRLTDNGGTNITLDKAITVPPGTGNVQRMSIGLAPSDNNILYSAIAAAGGLNNCTYGVYQSKDRGDTWTLIGPGGSAAFDPYRSAGCQGGWDNHMAVFPHDAGKIIVGGVSLWMWDESETAPGTGGWNLAALTIGGSLTDTNYVHADKHRIVIPDSLTVYVASDGGIGKSLDGGKTWGQNNNGFKVTQFYSVASAFGADVDSLNFLSTEQVVGGTQDNGTIFIGFNPLNPSAGQQITGGDGFGVAISSLANAAYSTIYGGRLFRNTPNGASGTFYNKELEDRCGAPNFCGPFFTRIALWEDPDVSKTYDSVKYFARGSAITAGDTIYYPSATNDVPVAWPAPKDLNPGDSIMLPDLVQVKLAFVAGPTSPNFSFTSGNLVYITKDAGNFNKATADWYRVASPESSETFPDALPNAGVFTLEFSGDGNHLYMGAASGGGIYRIDNLNEAYDSLTMDIRSDRCVLTCTRIANIPQAAYISDIAVDPNDPNNLVVTVPAYGGTNKVYRITNATTSNPGVLPIQGSIPQGMPAYSALIADHDENTVIVGTEYGIYASDDVFSSSTPTWTHTNAPLTAVYALDQQTLQYLYGSRQPKIENAHYRKVYAGTHGRGFWRTSSIVGIDEEDGGVSTAQKEKQIQFRIFPNPVRDITNFDVDMPVGQRASIEIYDLNGKLVVNLKDVMTKAGRQKIEFNASNLRNGTYIAALKAGDEVKVSKFVVMK